MRNLVIATALLLPVAAVAAPAGVDVRMPFVEEALRFISTQALDTPPEAALLRAGVVKVCGEDGSRPGCHPPGVTWPAAGAAGPDAAGLWRQILESVLAAESLQQGARFDKMAFERFVADGMVEALGDPGSFYIAPSVYKKISSIPTSFVGFGLRPVPVQGGLFVAAVHPGSPAHAAGLEAGDVITRVGGEPVTGYRRSIALAAIWGATGETLELTVRTASGASRDVRLKYKPWTFTPFAVEHVGNVAVVRIRHFERGLVAAVREAAASCAGVVLDVRDASSGLDDEMAGVADVFLGTGSIGSQKGRSDLAGRTWEAHAGSAGERIDVPVAVVLNRGTGGLAEVLAASLRAANRAILVGGTTGGVDTQETLRLFSEGSAIQLTSIRFLGPGGASLKEGVLPHVKTDRPGVVDMAVAIVAGASGPSLEGLLEAARKAIAAP
ncbi:MAG: S41 family peptidase [Deltaproteobacteria bacterium]|nr:S41 family peptidase [Deltaproteobacteria bacterium]